MVDRAYLAKTLAVFASRQTHYAPLHHLMGEVSTIYNNRLTIPLTDMGRTENVDVPNLLAQGIDQLSARAGSTRAQVSFTSVKPGQRRADRDATASAAVINGWWDLDKLPLVLKKRFRHLSAYSMSPVVMTWNEKEHRPHWDVRHPMTCYPSLDVTPEQNVPTNVYFKYARTVAFLADQGYGTHLYRLLGTQNVKGDTPIDIIEYYDGERCLMLACGSFGFATSYADIEVGGYRGVVLEDYAHGLGRTPVVIPMRITLDSPTGQFDAIIGMHKRMAKFQALEQIAVEKAIFPMRVLESKDGLQAKIVDGPWDGRTGKITVIRDGVLREMSSSPGMMTYPTIDRIERNERVTGGLPADLGGESGTNIRTARRGDSVMSAVIDFPIAEAQDVMAYALMEEDKLAIDLAKKYDGSNKRVIDLGRKPVTYTANDTFATVQHQVFYPVSGTDQNTLVVTGAQRVGIGTLSKKSFMVMDPLVSDPEAEHDQMIVEALEQATLSGLQNKLASGEMPPIMGAQITNLIATDKMELYEAMIKATADAMKAQAATGPGGAADPSQLMAPAGQQAMAGATIQPPEQGPKNLADLMRTTRSPNMPIRPLAGAASGAV